MQRDDEQSRPDKDCDSMPLAPPKDDDKIPLHRLDHQEIWEYQGERRQKSIRISA